MTVRELIYVLEGVPPDTEVRLHGWGHGHSSEIAGITWMSDERDATQSPVLVIRDSEDGEDVSGKVKYLTTPDPMLRTGEPRRQTRS